MTTKALHPVLLPQPRDDDEAGDLWGRRMVLTLRKKGRGMQAGPPWTNGQLIHYLVERCGHWLQLS